MKAEIGTDAQHGRYVRVTIGDTTVAVYIDHETGVVTTPRGQYGIEVLGPWYQFREAGIALAQSEQGRVPEGWKLVPVESTNKMLNAGMEHIGEVVTLHIDDRGHRTLGINPALWRVMLAAAPQPDTQEGESDD